ncbi:unnamed protein product, partial [Heterosigma akashiwo]
HLLTLVFLLKQESNLTHPSFLPEIKYFDHEDTAAQMLGFFPGLKHDDLPNGEGWSYEELNCITHCGTHLDAPYHYASTMDNGKPAITIDEVPLSWCFNPGVKLDFRSKEDGYVATADDIIHELERIGHDLQPLDIVVVNTAAGKRYGQDDYLSTGCGIGREATLFLSEQGVRVTGTDAWSWDAPFVHQAARYQVDGNAEAIWEGHRAGREMGYCHLEKLHNLEALPSSGFWISCFPVKIKKASAGFTRAVAIFQNP